MQLNEINIDEFDMVEINSVYSTNKVINMNDIQVEDNETFILENGLLTHNSAIASFTEIRDPETQAGMPLKGKVLNVYGKAPIDAMNNDEVADIITAINLEFNEQMGDWVISDNVNIYEVTFESIFEVDKEGEPIIKTVIVSSEDKFHLNKKWVSIGELVNNETLYRGYIQKIETSDATISDLSAPDYFHFRRKWEFRGFRKNGVKYEVKIGRTTLICNDIDEVYIDKKWHKVSMLLKKMPKTTQSIEIKKADSTAKLVRFHKWLRPAFDTKLKYSKIYIATDADPDGSAINNLVVNLFHEYFPELFWDHENPFINRIVFPMIAAKKGKKVLYYSNRHEFDEAKESGAVDDSWKIDYFKGLGSMQKPDWEYVFSNLDEYAFNITDQGHLDELMQIFFDDNASIRKEWLATK